MAKRIPVKEIPVIDVGPLMDFPVSHSLLSRCIKSIHDACRNIGFFYVKNHGIPDAHLRTVFSVIKEFFDLPLDEKMDIHIGKSTIFRGYTPIGTELTNGKRDWNEAVDFGLDLPADHPDVLAGHFLQGPNPWPATPPGFARQMIKHWDFFIELATRITEGLALSLGLERNFFHSFVDKSHSAMRILHYPPRNPNHPKDVGNGIGAHVDYGFLTILAQDDVGGLEVKNSNDEWISAPYIPGTFIINIGYMMERWTNDYYKATIHRVISNSEQDRYSFPFFFEPNIDSTIIPLAKFCSPEYTPHYEPLHFGSYLLEKFTSSHAITLKDYKG